MPDLTLGSLFSGIGSLDRAVEIVTGARVIWQIEAIAYRRAVLEERWPGVAQHSDVAGFEPARADLLCGGFPCRDISQLGSKEGLDGKKSGLWSEFRRIIKNTAPAGIFIENVKDLRTRGLDRVLQDLTRLGYDVVWHTSRGRDTGLHFGRPRIFMLACAQGTGWRRVPPTWLRRSSVRGAHDLDGCNASLAWPGYGKGSDDHNGPEPGVYRAALGSAHGVVARERAARVSALGDTVSIPQAVAAYRWCADQYLRASSELLP